MSYFRTNGDGTKPLFKRSGWVTFFLGMFLVMGQELLPLIENEHVRRAVQVGIGFGGAAFGITFGTKSKQA